MALTIAQQATLKAAIAADGTLNAFPNTSDGAFAIAAALNLPSSPAFTVWKSNVSRTAVFNAFDGGEVESLTTAESNRLQVIAAFALEGVSPFRIDTRALFDGVFSGAGGTVTRPALLALWKRIATGGEEIFATGTGSDADPATLDYEGSLSYQDVYQARNS